MILILILFLQIIVYSKGFRVSLTACIISFLLCLSCFISILLAGVSVTTRLNCLYVMSYVKFAVSFLNFIPQAWINFKTKSTVGFSIVGIWLDILSILQMLTLAFNFKDLTSIVGNFAKFLLGLISIVYDLSEKVDLLNVVEKLFIPRKRMLNRFCNAGWSACFTTPFSR